MTKKKMISILLVVISLLSFCSFSVCAEDVTMNASDMSVLMGRQVTTSDGTSTDYYSFTDGIEDVNGVDVHWYSANDSAYYASGAKKLMQAFDYAGFTAGHEYEMKFYTGSNYSSGAPNGISYYLRIRIDGNLVYEEYVYPNKIYETSMHFTMPDVVSSDTRVNIEMEIPEKYAIGSSDPFVGKVKYYVSEEIKFTDLTENPSWLGKILQKFSDLGDSIRNLGTTIGRFFTDLGERIGGFFSDLLANIKQKFDDLKTWIDGLGENIKQWFIDLGDDISEFFTMLKNYLLYFQHPVTVNADGVLIGKDGKPVYTNPFDSAIDKVKETVDDWLSKINDFVEGMEQSRLDVTGYLESGTGVINKVLKASPILTACVVFAVGFLVIRKVVGR